MCKGCPEFLEQKKPVFTRAAMLLVNKRWIEPGDHEDIVQSAYVRVLERKRVDPAIVSKPNRYLTRLMANLSIDELRRSTVTVGFDEHDNPQRMPIEQRGFDDEALMRHEALAREKYLGDFPTADESENTNELMSCWKNCIHRKGGLFRLGVTVNRLRYGGHGIGFEAAKEPPVRQNW